MPEGKTTNDAVPNDRTIKKEIKNDIIDNQNSFDSIASKTDPKRLAYELSQALDDQNGFAFYFECSRKYPEEVLRRILDIVTHVPDREIKQSRGALFTHLVKRVRYDY